MSEQADKSPRPPSFWQVVWSVLAAAFGVQSEQARQRDFSHGKPAVFIVAGLVFTIAFVVILVVIVNLVVNSAGG